MQILYKNRFVMKPFVMLVVVVRFIGQYIECKSAKTKDSLSQKYYPAINNI